MWTPVGTKAGDKLPVAVVSSILENCEICVADMLLDSGFSEVCIICFGGTRFYAELFRPIKADLKLVGPICKLGAYLCMVS